jgi:hypothetical protein
MLQVEVLQFAHTLQASLSIGKYLRLPRAQLAQLVALLLSRLKFRVRHLTQEFEVLSASHEPS